MGKGLIYMSYFTFITDDWHEWYFRRKDKDEADYGRYEIVLFFLGTPHSSGSCAFPSSDFLLLQGWPCGRTLGSHLISQILPDAICCLAFFFFLVSLIWLNIHRGGCFHLCYMLTVQMVQVADRSVEMGTLPSHHWLLQQVKPRHETWFVQRRGLLMVDINVTALKWCGLLFLLSLP